MSSESQRKASKSYRNKTYKLLSLDIVPEMLENWKQAASAAGQSTRAYIIEAVERRRLNESGSTATPPPDDA